MRNVTLTYIKNLREEIKFSSKEELTNIANKILNIIPQNEEEDSVIEKTKTDLINHKKTENATKNKIILSFFKNHPITES